MKAVSVLQPHASLIAIGAKKIETRSWATKYRGPLAIHASKAFPRENKELCREPVFFEVLHKAGLGDLSAGGWRWYPYLFGKAIATCNLVECLKIVDWKISNALGKVSEPCAILSNGVVVKGNEYHFGDYTPGRFAWILEDVNMLENPIPAKGQLGLWEWDNPHLIAAGE